jgi:hypothetical protein
MTYEQMKDLKPGDFKRACGVHPPDLRDHAAGLTRP